LPERITLARFCKETVGYREGWPVAATAFSQVAEAVTEYATGDPSLNTEKV